MTNRQTVDNRLEVGHLFLLGALANRDVDFILVGSCAEFLNGAPVHVRDVDVVHACDTTNVRRILRALEAVDAVFSLSGVRPNATHFPRCGHRNLMTRYGPLDLLGSIGSNLAYQDLLPRSVELDVAEALHIRVLDLETLIAIKEELGGEKDLAVLPTLRRTLEEKRKPPATSH